MRLLPDSRELAANHDMAMPDDRQVTLDGAVGQVYGQLRQIAHGHLHGHGSEMTLQTTALVHEAYHQLAALGDRKWNDRGHFLAVASIAMHHIMIDAARARASHKRGGSQTRITLEEEELPDDRAPSELLDIDDALVRLAALDERLARVVECRFFAGLSEAETAQALCITTRTVQRDWQKAKVLLRRALDR
jgi:RNA polymerase sigma factor (TIGR02999 family)